MTPVTSGELFSLFTSMLTPPDGEQVGITPPNGENVDA